jgi:Flp pilus assembly protein TadG
MHNRIPVSVVRRRKSGGQTIVESAFTFLPLFALIFAITDFGIMIFRWTTLQNAVREGTRYAVTFQLDGSGHQDTSIENQVQAYGMGFVHQNDNPQTIFVKYYNPVTLAQVVTGGNVPGNLVTVSVQNKAFLWIAPLAGNYSYRATTPLTLNVFASDILGGYPVGTTSVTE